MNYVCLKDLPTAEEVERIYPLSSAAKEKVLRSRKEIKQILEGKDSRLLMIIGPCSAWPKEAVFEYAKRLEAVNRHIEHAIKVVMRMYIQKPRTTKGWSGPVNQPDPFSDPDIEKGIYYSREMMVNVVELGLPIADECLFTHNTKRFSDLVSWFAIGARSSEDHEHRIFASFADCAVGLKNPTHGSLAVAVNSIVAAQHSHVAAIDFQEIRTFGNPYAHLVLRGSNQAPNYSIAHLQEVRTRMLEQAVKNPAVIIDVSHDNCIQDGIKNYRAQPENIISILEKIKKYPELKELVKGFMVESFLQEGCQKIEEHDIHSVNLGGLSITDPCLGWDETESFLRQLAGQLVA